MRQDQFERLQALQATLTDVFISEADPSNWPGAGIDLANLDKQSRGDRYWCKKNAVATIALMQRIESLTGCIQRWGSGTTQPDGDMSLADSDIDKQIDRYETEAAAILERVANDTRKTYTDRHVHGRKAR